MSSAEPHGVQRVAPIRNLQAQELKALVQIALHGGVAPLSFCLRSKKNGAVACNYASMRHRVRRRPCVPIGFFGKLAQVEWAHGKT